MQPSSISQPTQGVGGAGTSTWGRASVLLLLVLACIIGAFHETAWSIVSIWNRSDTFAHGFLIVPISLWLVWDKRATLRGTSPQPAMVPLALMLPLGFVWLVAYLVDVLVVQQFAFVGLLILAIWSVFGTPVSRLLAFPLGFLFLGVPVGEGLIYPMMNFTADFTVGMLRMTGIPVFRDGTFFSIPSGDWSVVEACSGVRYLIASVTLGVLYAYLTYTKTWKRLLFVGVSVVAPILANGMRAYLIVMIAHLSDMTLAVGVDHLVYGWVFFGIVITILFFIGAFWRDPPSEEREPNLAAAVSGSLAGALVTALAAVAVAGFWPAIAWALEQGEGDSAEVRIEAPAPTQGWRHLSASSWDWRPHVVGTDGEVYDFYTNEDGVPVGLYLGVYARQRQGRELLNSQNVMAAQQVAGREVVMWSDKEQTRRSIGFQGDEMSINQSKLASRKGETLLVWNWYRIGVRHTANPYLGKALEALSRLFGQRRDGTLIAVATPYEDKAIPAEATMQAFIDQMLPSIEQEINRALQQVP